MGLQEHRILKLKCPIKSYAIEYISDSYQVQNIFLVHPKKDQTLAKFQRFEYFPSNIYLNSIS
jgi:hypothetical protein